MPEDVSAYAIVPDPLVYTTRTSTRCTWASMPKNVDEYVYDDKGAAYFAADFEHYLTWIITAATNGSFCNPWCLANDLDDYLGLATGNKSNLAHRLRRDSGGIYKCTIAEQDGANTYTDAYTCSVSTLYYPRLKRDEAVGAQGTFYGYIYDDAIRTNLVDTLLITLHTSKKDYRYVYCTQSHNAAVGGVTLSGYIENLILDVTDVTVSPPVADTIAFAGIVPTLALDSILAPPVADTIAFAGVVPTFVIDRIFAAPLADTINLVASGLEEQLSLSTSTHLYGVGRFGQKLTIPNRNIATTSFFIGKFGNPTGNITFSIWQTDDTTILSQVWGTAVEILPIAGQWLTITWATPTTINQEVRMFVQLTGGDATNYLRIWFKTSDEKSGEEYTYQAPGVGPPWIDSGGDDCVYSYTYNVPTLRLDRIFAAPLADTINIVGIEPSSILTVDVPLQYILEVHSAATTETSPTSAVDPDAAWADEANAYDDDDTTYALCTNAVPVSWGGFIELDIAALSCDGMRFKAGDYGAPADVDIDIEYGAAWYHLYEGSFLNLVWNDHYFGLTRTITSVRIRFYSDFGGFNSLFEVYYLNIPGLVCILENASNISYTQEINAPHQLSFDIPSDDAKVSNITLANEIWLINYKTGMVIRRFKLQTKMDIRR